MRSTRKKAAPQLDVRTEPKDYRKELWIKMAAAVASANDCKAKEVPGVWADAALEAFDATFGGGGT